MTKKSAYIDESESEMAPGKQEEERKVQSIYVWGRCSLNPEWRRLDESPYDWREQVVVPDLAAVQEKEGNRRRRSLETADDEGRGVFFRVVQDGEDAHLPSICRLLPSAGLRVHGRFVASMEESQGCVGRWR